MFRRWAVGGHDRVADSHLSLMINYALHTSICRYYATRIRFTHDTLLHDARNMSEIIAATHIQLTNCRCFGQFAIERVRYSLSSTINYPLVLMM